MKRASTYLLVVGAILAPYVFLALLRSLASPSLGQLEPPIAPVVVPIREIELAEEQVAQATPVWQDGDPLLSPGLDGITTQIYVEVGSQLHDGEPVLAVNNIDRLAIRSPTPFYRALKRGDKGDDVAVLQGFLTDRGVYELDIDGVLGSATESALRSFEESIGISDTTGTFLPEYVVWLPRAPFVVGEIAISISAPAPSEGDLIARTTPSLSFVELASASGDALAVDETVKWVWEYDGELFAVDSDSFEIEAFEIPRLEAALRGQEAGEEEQEIEGTLRRRVVTSAMAVPPAAISVGSHDGFCVWKQVNSSFLAIPVAVREGGVGVVQVDGDFDADDDVLVNPSEFLADSSCP